jgi:hypothetical protein
LISSRKSITRQRRKDSKDNKGKDKGKNVPIGKWAPPSKAEKNRRVIDGIPCYYMERTKRWFNDNDVPGAPVANVAAVVTPTGRELALANAAHSINLAMTGLMKSFKDI